MPTTDTPPETAGNLILTRVEQAGLAAMLSGYVSTPDGRWAENLLAKVQDAGLADQITVVTTRGQLLQLSLEVDDDGGNECVRITGPFSSVGIPTGVVCEDAPEAPGES